MFASRRTLSVLTLLLPAALQAQEGKPLTATDPWAGLLKPRTHTPTPTTAAITAADLMSRLYRFADDSMQGRVTGSIGQWKGAEYIASEIKKYGLKPGGENGTYFQTAPIMTRELDGAKSVSVGGRTLAPWTDYVVRDGGATFDNVPVVYAGDFADSAGRLSPAAAAGKIVIVSYTGTPAVGNPPGIPSRGVVSGVYAGAAGVLVAGLEKFPPDQLASFKVTGMGYVDLTDGPPTPNLSYLYVKTSIAEELLGGPLASLKPGATGKAVGGGVGFKYVPIKTPARSVIGILPGSDPVLKNEYVAIGAHNDHIGTTNDGINGEYTTALPNDSMYVVNHLYRQSGADDSPVALTAEQAAQVNAVLAGIRKRSGGKSMRIDSIFNGADDDGSGSMSVLELAQYFSSLKIKPKRSMLFVWHVGEEEGLWGSQFFTDHPTVPRDAIVAQLNMDMVGRGAVTDVTGYKKGLKDKINGGPGYVQLVGSRRLSTELGDLAEKVNLSGKHGLKFDYSLDADGHEQNIYCRSDHYSYARYGIPIIFFTTGGHADYHQVTDEPQYINYNSMAKIGNYVADLAKSVANASHRPVVDKPKPDPKGACQQ